LEREWSQDRYRRKQKKNSEADDEPRKREGSIVGIEEAKASSLGLLQSNGLFLNKGGAWRGAMVDD
jgi:hypothetical protein